MIGAILGCVAVGGLVTGQVQKRKAQKLNEELKAKLLAQKASDTKLKKQVKFYDTYRALDNQLARLSTREGSKGMAYLIHGLEVQHSNPRLLNCLKNARNYRNQLSHDKRQWAKIPAPTAETVADLKYVESWVNRNLTLAGRIVWKGKEAFARAGQVNHQRKQQCKRNAYGGNHGSYNRRHDY